MISTGVVWISTSRILNPYIVFFENKINDRSAEREVYKCADHNEVIGYLTKADNLNLLVVRNAGHMVPLRFVIILSTIV